MAEYTYTCTRKSHHRNAFFWDEAVGIPLKNRRNFVLTIETKLQRNSSLVATKIDQEIVMLSIENGAYYGLAKTGGRIWELLSESRTIREICDHLQTEYNIDRETCEKQTLSFLWGLVQERLVDIVPE
jgi:coenzyme PQQ synthesis protein D (PqqD)